MNRASNRAIFLLGFLVTFSCAHAQNEDLPSMTARCTNALEQANEKYEFGELYEVEGTIQECIDAKEFNRLQKVTAYKLLTTTNLYLKRNDEARSNFLKLLDEDPLFETDPEVDPYNLVYFSEQFTTTPRFSHFIIFGGNMTFPFTIVDYRLDGAVDYTETNQLKPGLQGGYGFERIIKNPWSLGGRILFSYYVVSENTRLFPYFESLAVEPDASIPILQVASNEKQIWMSIPLYVKYKMDHVKFKPYFRAGFNVDLLLSSVMNLQKGELLDVPDDQSPQLQWNSVRNHMALGIHAAVGIKDLFRLNSKNFLGLEVEYKQGLTNLTNPKNRYSMINESAEFGFISDDFILGVFSVNAIIEIPKYFPRVRR